MRFLNREDAGRQLGKRLAGYGKENPLVLGLPRGGVPVAYEVATALHASLGVWVVRKVGVSGFSELGMGAVAEGGVVYLDHETIAELGIPDSDIQEIVREKTAEVAQRVKLFRGDRPAPKVAGRTVILVDDGIATGGTVRAAIQALRIAKPGKIVLAVPVAGAQSIEELRPLVDDLVCLYAAPELDAIGMWYDDFQQVADREVVQLLDLDRGVPSPGTPRRTTAAVADPQEVTLAVEDARLDGTLSGPASPQGLVLFAHGSGSSRFSPRNRHVASMLHRFGLATLLFDLLTSEEGALDEETAALRFDIELLTRRLVGATDWALTSPLTKDLPIGYFGSSTGAAAALAAAAQRAAVVKAVVSRGGRPDLAEDSLPQVLAPTLLIVGGEDPEVLQLNRRAYALLTAPRRLVIVPGATHLFEEPGALDAVARLAGEWFGEQLGSAQPELFASPSQAAASA